MIFKNIRENKVCKTCKREYVKAIVQGEDVLKITFLGYCDCVEKKVLDKITDI